MKIALISGVFFPQPGGAQVQSHNFANKLVEKNYDVHCYIFRKTNIQNNEYKIIKINYFVLSTVYFFLYYLSLDLSFLLNYWTKKIIKNNYKVWHFNFINFKSLILINSLKKFNQKIIVTFQGVDLQLHPEIKYGYRLDKKYDNYLKNTLNKVDNFIAISKNIKNDLLNLNIEEKKITEIPNTVNIEKFEKFSANKNKDKLNFITVGRFAEQKKGFDMVEKFCEDLKKRKINFLWRIVGKNASKILSENYIKNNFNHIKLIENIENIEEKYYPNSNLITLYKSSDIYINLSRVESFGITFIESLASGVPIISFNTKGINELIINNKNGFLISNFSTNEFINKIEKIYNDRIALKELSFNAKETVKKYDLNLNLNLLINLYNKF